MGLTTSNSYFPLCVGFEIWNLLEQFISALPSVQGIGKYTHSTQFILVRVKLFLSNLFLISRDGILWKSKQYPQTANVNTRCFIKGIIIKKADFYVLRNKTKNAKSPGNKELTKC